MDCVKRLLLLCGLALPSFAASWDGTYGDLKVFTLMPTAAALPMLPWAGATVVTEIFVSTSDPTTSAFRVVVRYANASGPHEWTVITPVDKQYMSAAIFSGLDLKYVTGVSITKMRDAETRELAAEQQ